MAVFDDLKNPVKTNLLVCFCDIARFIDVGKKIDGLELFELLNGMAKTAIEFIDQTSGRIIKFIGDSVLVVFPGEAADEGVVSMLELEKKLVAYFASRGLDIRLHVGVHYGEAVIGLYGQGPLEAIDVFGDNINQAAQLTGSKYHDRFVISPQAFRRLKPETRKRFHKYTPPIVYFAE